MVIIHTESNVYTNQTYTISRVDSGRMVKLTVAMLNDECIIQAYTYIGENAVFDRGASMIHLFGGKGLII